MSRTFYVHLVCVYAQIVNTSLERFGSTEGGSYFLGGTYTLADVAASTLFHRSIHVLKGHRDIDILALLKENDLERYSGDCLVCAIALVSGFCLDNDASSGRDVSPTPRNCCLTPTQTVFMGGCCSEPSVPAGDCP